MGTFEASSFFEPTIRVVDARMGRGKSTAAMRYMEEEAGNKRFLYITPYLSEVARVCECCDFEEPVNTIPFEDDEGDDNDEEDRRQIGYLTKSRALKNLLSQGYNIATTHALFSILDDEALALIRTKEYCLIIDESIDVIRKIPVTAYDLAGMKKAFITIAEDGRASWNSEHYAGKFYGYRKIITTHLVYVEDSSMMMLLNPNILRSFNEIHVLTYRFEGSVLQAYFHCFGFQYMEYGIGCDEHGPFFSPGRDRPPAIDYLNMIRLVKDSAFNKPGEENYSMTKNWYETHSSYKNRTIQQLRKNMINFLRRNRGDGAKTQRMWTCFKDYRDLLVPENGACRNNFVPLNTKATNIYKDCTRLAYMVNRYVDPNVIKFFAKRGFTLDRDSIALSEMLQWIWRSAIRDGKPIHLYVPSYRMRELLYNWMLEEKYREGSETIEKTAI